MSDASPASPAETKTLTDIHVHLAAMADGNNGCWISPKLRRSLVGFLLERTLKISLKRPAAEVNESYLDRLVGALRSSRYVAKAVGLALDSIHDEDGTPRLEESSIVVSNDYAIEVSKRHPEILLGASVHPYRRDAVAELERVKRAGAVLIKLLPVSQVFDPAGERVREYWRACARLELPVLVHTGMEFTLSGHVQQYGDPERLEAPLAEGATVIAAHACSRGLPLGEIHLDTYRRLTRSYPAFMADASALTLIGRCPMLLKLRKEPELLARLAFATDYPLPQSAAVLFARTSPATFWRAYREKNPFDKTVEVFKALGLEPTSAPFERVLAGQLPS